MAIKDNELVIWDEIHPQYTIFHSETETFSSLWSHYDGNIHHFQQVYSEDVARYGDNLAYWPKEQSLENVFIVSAIPWITFTSFTLGKYHQKEEKMVLPLAVQVHHSVCDGFHLARLYNELQALCNDIESLADAQQA